MGNDLLAKWTERDRHAAAAEKHAEAERRHVERARCKRRNVFIKKAPAV